MAFFKFEINTIEEAKMAKAMLDTYIKLSEGDSDKITINKDKSIKKKKDKKKKDIKPTVKDKVVNKPKKEVKEVEIIEDEKENIKFVDIQNLCRDIITKSNNDTIEREYRKSIANIALKYGSGKAIRNIDENNYPKAYSEIKELLKELEEEIPY
jgi:hypothetical protein